MGCICSGERVKKYRKLLKISQKQAAGAKLSHSMISLIESEKIQLTAATAAILIDNFNKIAEAKGIELNLSLKDMMVTKEQNMEEALMKELYNLESMEFHLEEYKRIYESAKEKKLTLVMWKVKEKMADKHLWADFKHIDDNRRKACREYEEAVVIYRDNKLQDEKGYCNLLWKLARLYYEMQEFQKCEKCLGELSGYVSKGTENYAELMRLMAEIMLAGHRLQEALYIYEELLESDYWDKPTVLHNLSLAFYGMGMRQQAEEYLNESLRQIDRMLDAGYVKNIMAMGQSFLKRDLVNQSVLCYESAVKFSKGHEDFMSTAEAYGSIFSAYKAFNRLDQFYKHESEIEELLFSKIDSSVQIKCVYLLLNFHLNSGKIEKIADLISKEKELYSGNR